MPFVFLLQAETPIDPTGNPISLGVMLLAFLIAGLLSGAGIAVILQSMKRDKAFLDTAEKLYYSLPLDEHRSLITNALGTVDNLTDALRDVSSNDQLNEILGALGDAVDVLVSVTDGLPNVVEAQVVKLMSTGGPNAEVSNKTS